MTIKRFVSVLIILSLSFTLINGCQWIDDILDVFAPDSSGLYGGKGKYNDSDLNDEELFDLVIDDLFAEWVQADAITMNFYLAYPEAMGIDRAEPTYGKIMTPELLESERGETEEFISLLSDINYNSLRDDQKIIYDILWRALEISEILERNDDFSYYTGYIRPLNGIQVQLPILLAEFNFYTAEDIELYLQLLEDTIRYFDDIINFERERAERGFFMSQANVDSVIEQIESFLENREDNLIIVVVNDKIDEYPGLSYEQRESFKERNRELVLNNVLVAYDNLLAAMRELRGVGAAPGGLSSLPQGDEFAHATLRLRAGTDKSPKELEALIRDWRAYTLDNVRSILSFNSDVLEKYERGTTGIIEAATPEEYMNVLYETMMSNFPALNPTPNYVITQVHESLREHMAPAFFLSPAVDNFNDNVIYVNPASTDDNLTLFTALAHEGYPGHMYQMVYSRQQSFHPIRVMLSNMGYTEGWAMHVELLSYFYAGLESAEADLMSQLRLYYMLLQSHADLGVNLLGWDKDDVANLLYMDLGITDRSVVDDFYNAVTGVPINTVIYTLGYIELYILQEDYAYAAKGGAVALLDFHRFFLDFGPAPYSIMSAALN